MLLAPRTGAEREVLQVRQSGLPELRRAHALRRQSRADRPATLFRADAEIPSRRARPRPRATAASDARAAQDRLRPAADLVCALRGGERRPRDIPAACADATADDHVSFLGRPERLAAADHWPQQ